MKVFYSDAMVADAESFSPSAGKPAEVVKSWRALGVPFEIMEPAPVMAEQFGLAHDRGFVDAVLAGKGTNGFGNRLAAVAAALPYTTGSMLAAARSAIESAGAAVAPCSGFHHAGYDYPGDFVPSTA